MVSNVLIPVHGHGGCMQFVQVSFKGLGKEVIYPSVILMGGNEFLRDRYLRDLKARIERMCLRHGRSAGEITVTTVVVGETPKPKEDSPLVVCRYVEEQFFVQPRLTHEVRRDLITPECICAV